MDPLLDILPGDHVWVAPFNPTAENMARYLLEVVGPAILKDTNVQLVSVRVEETPKCCAEAKL
jgi:6-pyruvoyltetrahydropterin/6-carboxytetrahydropterin synthase